MYDIHTYWHNHSGKEDNKKTDGYDTLCSRPSLEKHSSVSPHPHKHHNWIQQWNL